MCGIIGSAGNLTNDSDKVVRTLLILDSVRGEDSTGVALVPKVGETVVLKEVGPAFNLIYTKAYDKEIVKANRVVIGHNRFATVGCVSKETAHPFDFDTLVGVHNGTLTNKYALADSIKFKVDSENLYHHIEKHGLKDAINTAQGAYALVWWDKLEETINFLRNKERPLYYAYTKDSKQIFWASERWMLEVACGKNGVAILEIQAVTEDIHFSIKVDESGTLFRAVAVDCKQPVRTSSNKSNFAGLVNRERRNFTVVPKKSSASIELVDHSSVISEKDIASYSNKKKVVLNLVETGITVYGAKYIVLKDPLNPTFPIKMFVNLNTDILKHIGKSVVADIGVWVRIMGNKGFFKVSINSYELMPEDAQELFIYDDGKNHMLSKKEWEAKFTNCDWCFDLLFAEDHGNRINDVGQCFCGGCIDTYPEIKEHNPVLKKVY